MIIPLKDVSLFRPYATPLDLNDYPKDFAPCHRRVLSARHIPADQLQKSLSQLYPVTQLRDAIPAANRLADAIEHNEKIVIVGDYDADGATAMAVIVSVLKHLQANIDTVVPNRVRMGYGLSEKAVDEALRKNANLLITVDNGISAVDSVARLKNHHVDVIITDHHLPPDVLPAADKIINPNREDCDFPDTALAGVGVAFYLMLALRQVYRERKHTIMDAFVLTDLLPLVAIGTIADVVPLSFNNRILVEQGLKRIRAKRCPVGILALIEAAGLTVEHINAVDIAFQIAPRLNAAGRIADMQLGVDCLLTTNERLAFDYALALDRLNRERKALENEMKIEADRLLRKQKLTTERVSICLFDSDWNEGLIGILAARLKDKYDKTAFIFTRADNGLLKASARAGTAVNVIDALNHVNRQQPQLLENYGGHAKAAGLTMFPEHLPHFTQAIETAIAKQLADTVIDTAIYTDGELLPYELNVANADFLRTLEPWGNGLPEPLFENTFYIDRIREVGKNHAQLAMIESHSGQILKGIAFNQYHDCSSLTQTQCRVAYRLEVNEWRGHRSLSLIVTHIEALEKAY